MSEERNKLFDVRLDDHNFVARNPKWGMNAASPSMTC